MALKFEGFVRPNDKLENGRPANEGKLDRLIAQTYSYLYTYLERDEATRIWFAGQRIVDLQERIVFYAHVVTQIENSLFGEKIDWSALGDFVMYKRQPVDIETFIKDPYYLNKAEDIYPKVLDELKELNNGTYVEAVLTGGIGSAKTTTALYTNAYQLYLLSCMRNPHRTFGLDPASEILLIFQSINARLAKMVDYARFKSMIQDSKYFKEHFPFDKNIESKLVFPGRIEVVPVAGMETATIGQNVIGGLIDELNYMSVVEKSKQSVDKGTYDQAVALYNSIARRRKSRFLEAGKMPGILCLVSSKKYPGQFTDAKVEEAKKDKTIFVYDKRVWDVKPEGTFTKGWFHVFVGDLSRKPRILEPSEEVPDADRLLVVAVPEEFREDFGKDIINSLREIAGVSTLARHPYFLEVDRVSEAFGIHASLFTADVCDFVESRLGILKDAVYRPDLPRFAHIDLAISGDSAGVVVGTVIDFVNMKQLGKSDEIAYMPKFRIDGILEVRPPRNAEILFYKIRDTLVALRDKLGINLRWVTFDSFQSTDSQQLLRQQGFVSGYQSMDIVPCQPYDFLKSAIYDGRVEMPPHEKCQKEILMLERDLKTGKIDHPPAGSKDCADALAGVVYGLTMRREIWGMFGVPLVMIPSSVMGASDKLAEQNEKLKRSQEQAEMPEHERVRLRIA